MKKWSIFTLALALLLLAGCAGVSTPQAVESEQGIAIRLATDYREDSIGYRQLQAFAQTLQEKSKGTMLVKLYSAGEWSPAESFIDYVQSGSLEMACLEPAEMQQLQPAYELYQQPYLFASLQDVNNYVTGTVGRQALDTLPQAYYGIGFALDGYAYLLQQEDVTWISYGNLKKLGQTKALDEATVYDLRAIYRLQPLVTKRDWWEALTEEQQTWVQDSFQEAQLTSLTQQEANEPAQALLADGVIFADATTPAWVRYSNLYLNQREAYFAAHSDSLTAYWRPIAAPLTSGEEEPMP
jgi:TRAP-type C4-dicarboxylate transport system substrate-binding protein